MPIRPVWDSCLVPEMPFLLLPRLRRCWIHKALLTNRCWNVGRERYEVHKNITFKMLQESRYNSNKEQVRERTHVVKILGRSMAFVISENVRCRGHTICSTFHLQHTQVDSYAPNTHRNTSTTTHETFVHNMKIRSGYLELLRVKRHGEGNRRNSVTLLQKRIENHDKMVREGTHGGKA
jgi:hypothetical protein